MTTRSDSETSNSSSVDEDECLKKGDLGEESDQDDTEFPVVEKGRQNNGRWSHEEHEAFLVGLETYGKEWRKVASKVGTRTVMQVRTHAQKHFEKENGVAKILSRAKIAEKGSTPLKKRKIKLPRKERKKKKLQGETEAEEVEIVKVTSSATPASTKSTQTVSAQTAPIPASSKLPVAARFAAYPSTLGLPLSLPLNDNDILLPIHAGTATRPANVEYMEIMKINCFIFQALSRPDQFWFCRNLVHFLTAVRGRRWISSCASGSSSIAAGFGLARFTLVRDPVKIVEEEFRLDAVKLASQQYRPFWLLGEFDTENAHGGLPFCYRDVFGNWKKLTKEEIRVVLQSEGPKNLLLLPASVQVFNREPTKAEVHTANTENPEKYSAAGVEARPYV